MSTKNQIAGPSTSNFTAIFDAATREYKTLTRQDLATHPFAATLQGLKSPDSALDVFREQAQAFDKFRHGNDKLMASLTPIVNILFTFSETLGEGVGLVRVGSFYTIQYDIMSPIGILAREDDFHWNRYPSWGVSTLMFPEVCAHNVGLRQ